MKDSKKSRVIQVIGGLYHVAVEGSPVTYACKPKGLFRKQNIDPITGDFVDIDIIDETIKEAVITTIHPRKNQLVRPKVSNIDQAILVFSIETPPINLDLLDRLIVLSEEQKLDIIIALTKIDIKADSSIKKIYENIGYKVIEASIINGQGIDELKKCLHNKVSVLCGPSGVGKSSLTNVLYDEKQEKIQAVGKISEKGLRGKHTTRSSKLITIEKGYIVDSPGFSNVTFKFDKDKLSHYFKEFEPYLDICRFGDCSHVNEPDCGVKEQIGQTISQERYDRYTNFYKELSNEKN